MFYKQVEDKVNEYTKNLNAIFEGETIMSGVTKHPLDILYKLKPERK